MKKQEIKMLGNIFGSPRSVSNFAGSVFDIQYIVSALNSMQGGYRQPMILVVIDTGEKE